MSTGLPSTMDAGGDSAPTNNTSNLPQLPSLDGEVLLLIFTHSSVAQLIRETPGKSPADAMDVDNDEGEDPRGFGSSARLSELGLSIFKALITMVLADIRPILSGPAMAARNEYLTSDAAIDLYLTFYRLRERMIVDPQYATSLHEPVESRSLFASYVGAVVMTHGIDVARNWVRDLIESVQIHAAQQEEPRSANTA